MLTIYRHEGGSVRQAERGGDLPPGVIWIDLLEPTQEERGFVEERTHVRVPSREALSEIEATSRLIVDHGTLYLSTPVVARGETDEATLSPAGFIVSAQLLVTVRYTPLATFDAVAKRMGEDDTLSTPMGVFLALLEAIVDRGADVLERLGAEVDRISRSVFRGDPTHPSHAVRETNALRKTLSKVGTIADRGSQARDVLLGVGRIAGFSADICDKWLSPELHGRLAAVSKDITSLNDYEAHLAGKIQFLLDAVLGYITIEQNDLFKVLTIASVVGIPPVLLAGIWGMNFKNMPELDWHYGYPVALALITISGVIPLVWFKVRGWF